MNKRLISLIAAALMIAQIVAPVFAIELNAGERAAEPVTETKNVQSRGTYENLKYEIADDKVTITGYETNPEGELVIPEMIEDCPVTEIGEMAFNNCFGITSLNAPSVVTVGKHAFYNCYKITEVYIPKAERICDFAFLRCEKIAKLDLPAAIMVGEGAFKGDDAVDMSMTEAHLPNAERIGRYAFSFCSMLTSIEIPAVKAIGTEAFRGCTKLTSITIPADNGCYFAEDGIIYDNDKTTVVSYPSASGSIEISALHIAEGAFASCVNLTSVSMPETVSVGSYAFFVCHNLKTVNMPKIAYAAGSSFYETEWYDKLNNEFEVFGDGVLIKYCGADEDVIIPDNVKCVAGFIWNETVRTVDMPSVKVVGDDAFNNCHVVDIKMPAVEKIGNRSFINSHLTKVELKSVKEISDAAFNYCRMLSSAYFLCDAPNVFGTDVFTGCAEDFTIYFAKGAQGWTTPMWNSYPTQEFDPDVQPTPTQGPTPTPTNEPTPTPTNEPTPTPTNEPTPTPTSEPEIITGDLNGDGKINTADAVVVLKSAAGMIQLDEKQTLAGDANRDGKVNTADAVLILKYAAGMITAF